MKLTDTQLRAVEHNGRNLQLIACAGSGKTELVARRVVHLLTPDRLAALVPGNIIAFTFSEKAAAEPKERIVTRTRQVVHALRPIPERGFRVLRVIYNETAVPVRVLTAYLDEK